MPPQFLSGRKGEVKVGSTILNVTGWTFTPEASIEDTTNTGDVAADGNTYESHLGTTIKAKGNFKADWDALARPTDATPNLQPMSVVAIKLYLVADGDYIDIPVATITSFPLVSEVKGKISFTCEFQVNGVFTWPV
jgi:hypothetical protein